MCVGDTVKRRRVDGGVRSRVVSDTRDFTVIYRTAVYSMISTK